MKTINFRSNLSKSVKISRTHQRFANSLRNQRALDCPEEFLGPNWKDVLNFWLYLDTLSGEQFGIAGDLRRNLRCVDESENLAYLAACVSITTGISYEAHMSAPSITSGWATRELIGANKILGQGKLLTFVPIFLNP